MAEDLEIYDLNSNLIGTQDRQEFYDEIKKEFKKTGKITKKVKTIKLLLLNSFGRIYLQKRSKDKQENPNLYDKTVGGHISAGDSFEMTVVRECAEELGFPAVVLPQNEFDKAIKVTDLSVVGIFREIEDLKDFDSVRISKDGSKIIQPMMTKIYIGYYNGKIGFMDGESSGVQTFSLDELKQTLDDNPNNFTEDVKFMVEKYEKFLVPIE